MPAEIRRAWIPRPARSTLPPGRIRFVTARRVEASLRDSSRAATCSFTHPRFQSLLALPFKRPMNTRRSIRPLR
eukprot:31083-Pelagococcus_subviridis.AAC.18